jgi:hypothetical protein
MISKDDKISIEVIETKWTDFAYCRRKKEFEYTDNHPCWLSMLEREDMLTTLLRILNKYQKKRTKTTYEYEID